MFQQAIMNVHETNKNLKELSEETEDIKKEPTASLKNQKYN